MNINSVYKSNYLKAEDLNGRRVNVVISGAIIEKIGDEEKLVLEFEGKDKKLVLNVTNARTIADLLNASDTEQWIGKEITLRPDKTQFNGQLVNCLRVDSVLPNQSEPDDIPF